MSSLAAFEAAIRVKVTRLIKSCLKTRKKWENMEIQEFTTCEGELMSEEALTSLIWRILLVCGSGIVIELWK